MKIWMWIPTPMFLRYMVEKLASCTIEVDTNEDEEVLELIRRLIALLEKENSNETI